MEQILGSFEGRKVEAAQVKIKGGASDRVGTLHDGEMFFFIGRASVSKITHGDVKEIYTRTHDANASALVILLPEDGERMLSEAQMMADDRFGIQNLFAEAGATLGYDTETGEIDNDDE